MCVQHTCMFLCLCVCMSKCGGQRLTFSSFLYAKTRSLSLEPRFVIWRPPHLLGIFLGAGDAHCLASALPVKPPPQPLLFLYKSFIVKNLKPPSSKNCIANCQEATGSFHQHRLSATPPPCFQSSSSLSHQQANTRHPSISPAGTSVHIWKR